VRGEGKALVPVSAGSEHATTMATSAFLVTQAHFAANAFIPPHVHDRPCVAVMLSGSFDVRFCRHRELPCEAGTVVIEPQHEEHCNCISPAGATVLVIQPDVQFVSDDPALRGLLSDIRILRVPDAMRLAAALARESSAADDLTPLMLDSLAAELLVNACRMSRRPVLDDGWLPVAEALIRARFRDRIGLREVASACGVHPAHVARAFRRQYGASVGRFVANLRVEWVAHQLRASTTPIVRLAMEAGFADQAHLTHRFTQVMGVSPARWRRAHRSKSASRGPGDEG